MVLKCTVCWCVAGQELRALAEVAPAMFAAMTDASTVDLCRGEYKLLQAICGRRRPSSFDFDERQMDALTAFDDTPVRQLGDVSSLTCLPRGFSTDSEASCSLQCQLPLIAPEPELQRDIKVFTVHTGRANILVDLSCPLSASS